VTQGSACLRHEPVSGLLEWPEVQRASGLRHGRRFRAAALLVPALLVPTWRAYGEYGTRQAALIGALVGLCVAALILAILLVAVHRACLTTQLKLVRGRVGTNPDAALLLVRVVNNGRSIVQPKRVGVRTVSGHWKMTDRVGPPALRPGESVLLRLPLDSVKESLGLTTVQGISETELCMYTGERLDLLEQPDTAFLPSFEEEACSRRSAEIAELPTPTPEPALSAPWIPSRDLEKARALAGRGKYGKAVDTLWSVEAIARTDSAEAQALLDTATALRVKVRGGKQADCEELIASAETILKRLSGPGDGEPFARFTCSVLSSRGMPFIPGEDCDVTLFRTRLVLTRQGERDVVLTRMDLWALEIGGPGARRSGGDLSARTIVPYHGEPGALLLEGLRALGHPGEKDTLICMKIEEDELLLITAEGLPDTLYDPETGPSCLGLRPMRRLDG
jgi:hypothetical protein